MDIINAIREDAENLIELIEEGTFDLEASDRWGNKPLHVAVEESSRLVVKALLDNGADPDAKNNEGLSALHLAASTGKADKVRTLLDGGADPDLEDASGRTALHHAAGVDSKCVETLLVAKADVDATDRLGMTPLHHSMLDNGIPKDTAKIVGLLVKEGADINAKDIDGDSPFDMARVVGKDDCLRAMGSIRTASAERNRVAEASV